MNIAIIGYGRMGKTIERIAQSRGHHIVHIHDGGPMDLEALKAADVAIEFTQPEAAAENIAALLTHGIPVVSGTTGWLEHKASMDVLAQQHKVGFLYASNFSTPPGPKTRLTSPKAKAYASEINPAFS